MANYVTLGVQDTARSNAFYDATLPLLGWAMHAEFPGWRGYSKGGEGKDLTLWLCEPFNGEPATAGNGTMFAFMVSTHAEVDAFYQAAMAHGGSDEGAPGPRPHYTPTWYATYVRDPSGNKLAVVCNE
ncbi:VOC family protein [Leeia sp.]|uniref:VOC family protein n=1 Tax=Leeia sp. TaxID=2884678 RepID=UPI0035AE707A